MSAQHPQVQNPRFGFSPKQLINTSLTNAAPTGTAIARPPGLQSVVVLGVSTAFGVGSVSIIVEGSNDGSNWVQLAESQASEYITGSGQTVVLNESFGGQVDLQHWAWVRVRTAIAAGAPTWAITVIVSGIAMDCESFLRGVDSDEQFGPRVGTLPTFSAAPSFRRPAGTLLANCQVVASGVVLGTLTSFDAVVQGSPDNGTTWVDIGTVSITADGAQAMSVNNDLLFSLGQYADIRFAVRDNGAASVVSAYTSIRFYFTMDSCDWLIDNPNAPGGSSLGDAFIVVQFGAPGPEVADTISIAGQVYNTDGVALSGSRKLEVIVYDTSQAGDLDLANNATFSAVGTGTAIAGVGTNRVVLTTDATGAFEVDVLNLLVEINYVCAVNPQGPNAASTPQVIVANPESAALTFT